MTSLASLPLVTVVTPSYNQGRFIEETILSVLNQDYPNIEYLVVDGGSTDATLDILRKFESRLTWISEPDRGQSQAINKGFVMAKGEIICWLNSDDTFEPGAIHRAVEHLCRKPQVMLVYGDGKLIDEYGGMISAFPYTRPFDLWALAHQLDFILQPTTFFRKSALQQVGYLNEDLHWCMDWDLWIRIGCHYPVEYIPYCMANARIYGDTKTSTGGFKRFMEIVSILRTHCKEVVVPAYIIYGGGMFSTYLQAKSNKWYRLMRKFLRPVRMMMWTFASNAQGVYQDGWLGKKAKFMFASGLDAKSILISVDVPEHSGLLPNEAKIFINDEEHNIVSMNVAGNCGIMIPYDPSYADPTEVTITFKRSLRPDLQMRRLACKLLEISIENE